MISCSAIAERPINSDQRGIQMDMPKNVGPTDKSIRIGAGAVLLLFGLFKGGWLFTLIGIILLATGFLGTCPAYTLLGKNTNK